MAERTQCTSVHRAIALLWALWGLLLPCGCGSDSITLYVIPVQQAAQASSLQVSVALGDRGLGIPPALSAPGDASYFRVLLPADASGIVQLTVDGVDAAGCFISQGHRELLLDGSQSTEVILPLGGGATACPVPSGTTQSIRGIWGSAPSDVWAVGSSGTFLHWDGLAWTAVLAQLPGPTTVQGVWGSGPSDLWAVGSVGTNQTVGIILHSQGTEWAPVYTSTVSWLRSVWGSGPNDVWVAGAEQLLHWDGSAWSPITVGTAAFVSLSGLWGSGPTDVWAVGEYEGGALMMHWDGTTWASTMTADAALDAVWGSGPRDVWAAGGGGSLLHWDGVSWQAVTYATMPPLAVNNVWGSGADDVWVIGESTGANGPIWHWNGSAWAEVPSGSIPYSWFEGVWGSGPNDVWAAGNNGTFLNIHP